MSLQAIVIHLHPSAPAKPPEGGPCNGCGVCCASEPCPAGRLVSRRRHGACKALVWQAQAGRYRCGLVEQPRHYLPAALGWAAPWVARLARRWIAAGRGCDSSVSVERG